MAGLDDLAGLFQPKLFCDSTTLGTSPAECHSCSDTPVLTAAGSVLGEDTSYKVRMDILLLLSLVPEYPGSLLTWRICVKSHVAPHSYNHGQSHKPGGFECRNPQRGQRCSDKGKKEFEERVRLLINTSQVKIGTSQQSSEGWNLRNFPNTEGTGQSLTMYPVSTHVGQRH